MGAPGEDDQPGLNLQLVRIEGEVPEGFDALRAEADAEGHRNMALLAAELAERPEMFTALLAAFRDGRLVGVGGLTPEPEPAPELALRMRRLYVRPAARARGVARAICSSLLHEALGQVGLVTVHAGNPDAERFWEAMGFRPAPGRPWSHAYSAA